MSDLQKIEGVVSQLARRRRWQQAWQGLWWGLVAGSCLWLLVLTAYKLLPLPPSILLVGGSVALALSPAGLIWGGWSVVTTLGTARWLDRRLRLQERLSTALECERASSDEQWRTLLVTDAIKHAQKLDAPAILPWHVPRCSHWALVALVLGAGLGFVPEYRSKAHLQKQRDVELVKEVGQQLADLTRRNLQAKPPALEPVRQNLDSTVNLGDQMKKATLSRSEALKEVTKLADKLKQDAQQMAQSPALKRLDQAARNPDGNSAGSAQALQKKLQDLQNSLGKATTNSEALEQFRKDLQKAQAAAAALANKTSGDSAAQEQLGKSLASLSQEAQTLGLSLPGLEEAIQALAANQTDLMVKDLQSAMTDLEKMQALAQKFQQLQQQMDRLGKDLAEQLANGQAKAAQNTLEKMAEQLQSNKLSLEQMKAIMDEVAKAVQPAGDYGKVADLLKQGASKMGQGQRQEAAKDLAQAAKELEKMLGEMADLESLKETLAALEKGGMCLANGDMWGQSGRPGHRPGKSRGGRGFGDWADEDSTAVPEMSDLWENPADNRGQMDPRSAQDRGDGQLADNLDPTKIRGKLSPGNSMPAITLKGVSIKGMSTASYQEAVMAAQSSAQSALNQEQIPRAYQGAVKDYFDDLKK